MPGFIKLVLAGAALASLPLANDAGMQVIDPAALPFQAGRLGVPSATVGSPDKEGLYLFYVKYERGMRSPVHVHGDDRMLTVLRGTLYLGQGTDQSPSSMTAIKVGSSIVIRAGTKHFGWAKDGRVLTQEIGAGPTSTTVISEAT